jgi:hypothetical protein
MKRLKWRKRIPKKGYFVTWELSQDLRSLCGADPEKELGYIVLAEIREQERIFYGYK